MAQWNSTLSCPGEAVKITKSEEILIDNYPELSVQALNQKIIV
jgi:hypothetical protein